MVKQSHLKFLFPCKNSAFFYTIAEESLVSTFVYFFSRQAIKDGKVNSKKGLIALDIDGTITEDIHKIPERVAGFLKKLWQQGWQMVFITGRTFSFGHSTLKNLDFPYYFAVQNGADILEMPKKRQVSRHYLENSIIPSIEELYGTEKEDFIIYAGHDKGDFCYYRPNRFSPFLLSYLEEIKKLAPEPWKEVSSFQMDALKTFPLIKCLGSKEAMTKINQALNSLSSLHVTLIRDPIGEGLYLNLVTSSSATKGKALIKAAETLDIQGPLIAAGDDLNDISMIEKAHIRIVMETAPKQLLDKAHIIAPSAAKEGIIPALSQAIKDYTFEDLWD